MSVGTEIGALIGTSGSSGLAATDEAPPVNTVLPAISGSAIVGESLSASHGGWDSGTNPSYAYQWQRAGVAISGATSSSYTLVAADYGAAIRVVVSATNTLGTTDATSAATASVTEPAPVNTALPVITGTPTIGQALSVSNGTWESVTTPSYAYQWQRDGVAISGATSNSYTLVVADYNAVIRCVVSATNSAGSAGAASAATASVAEGAPVNTALPVISGTTTEGQSLSVSNGSWESVSALSYSYQWERGGTAIAGATSSSYTLQAADVGSTLICVVTATNAVGGTAAESAATAAIAGNVPSDSLSFNGSSAYLTMSDANFGAYDRARFAIAGAFRLDAISGTHILMRHRGGFGTFAFDFYVGFNGSITFIASQDGSGGGGQFDAAASTIATNTWYAFLLHYDSAHVTSGERLKLWLNGSAVAASSYSAPSAAIYNSSADLSIGASSSGAGLVDGLIYQPTFFSGALPAPADVFDGTAGKLKNLSVLSGAHSSLDASTATNDVIRASDWTNNGSVGTSATTP